VQYTAAPWAIVARHTDPYFTQYISSERICYRPICLRSPAGSSVGAWQA
jgi:hypothetical protein